MTDDGERAVPELFLFHGFRKSGYLRPAVLSRHRRTGLEIDLDILPPASFVARIWREPSHDIIGRKRADPLRAGYARGRSIRRHEHGLGKGRLYLPILLL